MNKHNDELKKKIISALQSVEFITEKGWCGQCISLRLDYSAIADALIAAGLTFDKTMAILAERTNSKTLIHKAQYYDEMKHRAEVAERALDKATELAYTYRTQDDTLSCSSCPFDSIFDRCKERGLYEDCSKRWKEELLQQAEKELAEESKDD